MTRAHAPATNIKIVNVKVPAILGEKVVKAIKIVEFTSKQELQEKVDGVFISLGWVPSTEIVKKVGIDVDEGGCVKVDRWQRTNIEAFLQLETVHAVEGNL